MEYRDDEQYHGFYLTEDEIEALPVKIFDPKVREEYLALRARARQRQYPPGYLGWIEQLTASHVAPIEAEFAIPTQIEKPKQLQKHTARAQRGTINL